MKTSALLIKWLTPGIMSSSNSFPACACSKQQMKWWGVNEITVYVVGPVCLCAISSAVRTSQWS